MTAIQVTDLKKYYGKTKAVNGITFTVGQGEVFGMLGPNGAGKTTTVEIIEGLRTPDSGQVTVLGYDIQKQTKQVKARIGVQLQTTALYPKLTVVELLNLFRTFFPGQELRTTDELIDMVSLDEKRNTYSKDLSGGQRQRLSVALALINKPEIVFLDEPTTGLDPQARRNMWDTVREIQETGATVFLTTHYMEEAHALCNRVAVIDAGQIIALNSPVDLIKEHFQETAIEFEDLMDMPERGAFKSLPGVTRTLRNGRIVTLYTTDTTQTLSGLTKLSDEGAVQFDALNVRRATLEDVFLKLTGKRIRE